MKFNYSRSVRIGDKKREKKNPKRKKSQTIRADTQVEKWIFERNARKVAKQKLTNSRIRFLPKPRAERHFPKETIPDPGSGLFSEQKRSTCQPTSNNLGPVKFPTIRYLKQKQTAGRRGSVVIFYRGDLGQPPFTVRPHVFVRLPIRKQWAPII